MLSLITVKHYGAIKMEITARKGGWCSGQGPSDATGDETELWGEGDRGDPVARRNATYLKRNGYGDRKDVPRSVSSARKETGWGSKGNLGFVPRDTGVPRQNKLKCREEGHKMHLD